MKSNIIVIAAVSLFFLIAWVIQLLWNGCLVGAVTGVNEIGYYQAIGITILANLLTGRAQIKSKS